MDIDLDGPRLLGTVSGLSLVASLTPRPDFSTVGFIMITLAMYCAFAISPVTFVLMSSGHVFIVFHATGMFISAFMNSMVLLPLAFRVSPRIPSS